MTPDLHGHRPMSPISGGSSPLTQRNRFPTSSGRASTAMALCWSTPPRKTSQQRRPYRPVIYDIKPALKESNGRKKIKKEKLFVAKSWKTDPGDLNVLQSPPARASVSFLSAWKNGGTLNRITTAIHTCVSPLDPKAFTDRSTVVSLRSTEPYRYYFRKATFKQLVLAELPRLLLTASVDSYCYYCHCNSTTIVLPLATLLL